MFGLFKKAPKLEASFAAKTAVARELAKEIVVTGDLVVKNVGGAVSLQDLEVVLVAGGTRRIDLELPAGWKGTVSLAAGAKLEASCDWHVKLAAPMRAPHAEIQLNTTTGGKHTPLARTKRFDLHNE